MSLAHELDRYLSVFTRPGPEAVACAAQRLQQGMPIAPLRRSATVGLSRFGQFGRIAGNYAGTAALLTAFVTGSERPVRASDAAGEIQTGTADDPRKRRCGQGAPDRVGARRAVNQVEPPPVESRLRSSVNYLTLGFEKTV
jgi:hypothetical protein